MTAIVVKGGASDIERPLSIPEEALFIVLTQSWIDKLGLTINEAFPKARKIIKETQEAGAIKITTAIDDHGAYQIFPIFANDTLEDLISRHYQISPINCKATMQITNDMEGGFTKARLMRLVTNMPPDLRQIIWTFDKHFFSNPKKAWNKIKEIAPNYFTKRTK